MHKRVLVIASGNTERLALPHLTAHLQNHGIAIDVRIPPKNRPITAREVQNIIQTERFIPPAPDKYVVLVDTDGKSPEEALHPIRQGLQNNSLIRQTLSVHYAYAQWHLEAWYFADSRNLRIYLGRDMGEVNPNQPDQIQNPKHHLRQLLGEKTYTAQVSAEIAAGLDPQAISQRSPSFLAFLAAVRNGTEH